MSGPRMGINPKKMPLGANVSRASGCSAIAESLDPMHLLYALTTGNRATRRAAKRKILVQARAMSKAKEGGAA